MNRERREQLGELQKNLGLTLAAATQSDTADMTEWKRHMVDIGDQEVGGKRGGLLGFQVMSNLMRAGDYDDDFMKQYGKSLMETERKFTSDGRHGAWQRMGFSPYLNHMKGDTGFDPVSGYLKGLSNNPGAATDFFNDDFIPKDGDHKHAVSNFKYLFEDRHWPHESNSDVMSRGESTDGRNNLASALEAATTGHPAGELPTGDTPAHSPGQAKLFEDIVSSISDDNGRLRITVTCRTAWGRSRPSTFRTSTVPRPTWTGTPARTTRPVKRHGSASRSCTPSRARLPK